MGKVGELYTTNEGYKVEIVKYIGYRNCSVKFLQTGKVVHNLQYINITKGNIKNPIHKSVYGVGYFGEGVYKSKCVGIEVEHYRLWKSILLRSYSIPFKDRQPRYIGVTVCEEWHNYQNFAKWYEENHIEGFALDKDILFKGNKIYSPETCCFVPQGINNLFTEHRGVLPRGVYENKNKTSIYVSKIRVNKKLKTLGYFDSKVEACEAYTRAKTLHIIQKAEEYKHLLKSNVYQALINYKVEITD